MLATLRTTVNHPFTLAPRRGIPSAFMATPQPRRCAASASAISCRATRALFDERGMQDAPIEEIARAVGIARGLIYRHFSSKEELFVLTVTDYLAELAGAAGRGDRLRPRAGGAARGLRPRLRRLLPALPRLPRLLPSRSCTARPASSRDRSRTPSGCASARAWPAASSSVSEILRAGAAAGVFHRRGPRLHGQRAVDPGPRRRCTSRASASASARPPRGSPSSSPWRPSSWSQTCVASALATVGATASQSTS